MGRHNQQPAPGGHWEYQKPAASEHSYACVHVGRWVGDGVQVGEAPDCGLVPVFDSHDPGTVITVPRYDMQVFLLAVKAGEYDWLLEPQPAPSPPAARDGG